MRFKTYHENVSLPNFKTIEHLQCISAKYLPGTYNVDLHPDTTDLNKYWKTEKLESCWFELTITVKGNLFRALHGLWFFSEILTVFMLKLVEI